jgi:hypothetical protein
MLSGRGKKEHAKEAQIVAKTGEDGLPSALPDGAAEGATALLVGQDPPIVWGLGALAKRAHEPLTRAAIAAQW